MKITATVAFLDGVAAPDGMALSPGSLAPCRVPVTIDFDFERICGTADVRVVDGTHAVAEMDVDDDAAAMVRNGSAYASMGFRAIETEVDDDGLHRINKLELVTIVFHRTQNADPRVPPVGPLPLHDS